jgi:hypothetical protein
VLQDARRRETESLRHHRRRAGCIEWGLVQVVDDREIQFTKSPEVLRGMDLDGLDKRSAALAELRAKGLG